MNIPDVKDDDDKHAVTGEMDVINGRQEGKEYQFMTGVSSS